MAHDLTRPDTLCRDTRRLLGITVLLSQLPLMFHIPLWLSLPAMLLVLVRTLPRYDTFKRIAELLIVPLVVIAAVAIVLHYGDFFGRDPCVAFLFMLVGFKYAESSRSYDASLVVVLCAFLLLTQFFYWQSIIAAVLTIPALLFVGLALFSLQRGTSRLETRHMINVTSTLFVQAIPIAMILFLAIPRIPGPGWNDGTNGQSVTGLSSRMSPGTVAELSRSEAVAFRVEFDGPPPSAEQLYWRGPVMSGFDGKDWFILPSISSDRFQPTETNPATTIAYTVTLAPTHHPWLPTLDTLATLPVNSIPRSKPIARINEERQINATRSLRSAIRYQATSRLSDRFRPRLTPGAENLTVSRTNPRATAFAKELRARHPSAADFTRQVLQWFNREAFHYTLTPPVLGEHPIDDFLFTSRRGFCEHYASSFVFLLRVAGIPARVVTGYQGGELNGDYMIVRQSDAHAWAEAFINGRWQRFDPTASVAPARVEHGIDAAIGSERAGAQWLDNPLFTSIQLQWDTINFAWQRLVIGFDSQSQDTMWQRLGINKPSGLFIVLVLLGAAAVWMAIILLPSMMRSSGSSLPCEVQWQKLCTWLDRKGMPRHPTESSSQYISRLCKRLPQHRRSLTSLHNNYQRGVFSREGQNKRMHRSVAREMKSDLHRLIGHHR